jgi:hypothetical protein
MVPFGFQSGRNGPASFLEDSLVNRHLPFKGWGYVFFNLTSSFKGWGYVFFNLTSSPSMNF